MRILFVLGDYYPKASANGVCVINLQEELYKRGIHSDVICEGEKEDTIEGKYGEIRFVSKNKDGMMRKIKRLIIWPMKNIGLVRNYRNAIKQMQGKERYDLTVAVQRPIEGAFACASIGDYVLYELDSITNNGDNLYGIKHFLRYRPANIEKRIYNNAKHIYHLYCHNDYYEKVKRKKYEKYQKKSSYIDIPYFADKSTIVSEDKDDSVLRITYLGTLSKLRNTPDYAIKLLSSISSGTSMECLFYSRGCEEALNNANREYPHVFKPMGYVSYELLKEAKSKTDCFLSIGFNHTGTVTSIPSKVFDYMTTGKPIIHIVGGRNDTAIPYLEQYGNAIMIDPEDDITNNAKRIIEFIKYHRHKRVGIQELREMFPMNTPEYTIDKMINQIQRR